MNSQIQYTLPGKNTNDAKLNYLHGWTSNAFTRTATIGGEQIVVENLSRPNRSRDRALYLEQLQKSCEENSTEAVKYLVFDGHDSKAAPWTSEVFDFVVYEVTVPDEAEGVDGDEEETEKEGEIRKVWLLDLFEGPEDPSGRDSNYDLTQTACLESLLDKIFRRTVRGNIELKQKYRESSCVYPKTSCMFPIPLNNDLVRAVQMHFYIRNISEVTTSEDGETTERPIELRYVPLVNYNLELVSFEERFENMLHGNPMDDIPQTTTINVEADTWRDSLSLLE